MTIAERIASIRRETERGTPWDAVLDHIEDVLGRHVPANKPPFCPYCEQPWPCPDAAAALTLLDGLDGGETR